MKQMTKSVLNVIFNYYIVFVVLFTVLLAIPQQQSVYAQIPDEAKAKIEAAAPGKTTVRSAVQRKLLIFNLCKGYKHDSIPYCDYALQTIGKKTGAYTTVISDDPAVFNADNIGKYDAILFNNTTGQLFTDPVLKQNLLNFVKSGKGIIGIHAATDCFYDWPEFGEMMGGYFNGHPWNEEVTVKLDIPDHPINAAFNGQSFAVADEIYQFKNPYSRNNLQILLSLDIANTDMTKGGILRDDGDFAVSWIRAFGKGRVFYCSLGHRFDIFWNPKILQHYLDGILFAMGDLPLADLSPSAKADSGSQNTMQNSEDVFAQAARYDYGQSRLALSIIAEQVRLAISENPDNRNVLVAHLLNLIESETSTNAAKDFACRQLAIIGGEESVPALAKLLLNPELSHMARYALQNIPAKSANDALCSALLELDGEQLIGVINTIGIKADPSTANSLLQLPTNGDNATGTALAEAFKRIPIPSVIEKLLAIINQPENVQNHDTRNAAINSLLICGDLIQDTRGSDAAYAIYKKVYDLPGAEDYIQFAAFQGMANTSPLKVIPLLLVYIEGSDPYWQKAAKQIIAMNMPGQIITKALNTNYAKLTSHKSRIMFLEALADRGDFNAGELFIKESENENQEIAIAAIKALGSVPVPKSIPFLIKIAATDTNDDAVRNAARASINQLQKPNRIAVDTKIMSHLLFTVNDAEILECISAISARNITNRSNKLLDFINNNASDVRIASWQALGKIADTRLWPELISKLDDVNYKINEEVLAAQNALLLMNKRISEPVSAAVPLIAAMQTANDNSKKIMIYVLGKTGYPDGLKIVNEIYQKDDNLELRQTALQTLANWPDTSALDSLYAIIIKTSDARNLDVAFDGYIRITMNAPDLSDESRLVLYKHILPETKTTKHITQLLEGLSDVALPEALEIAENYLTNHALNTEAAAATAMIKISRSIGNEYRDNALAAINRAVVAVSPADESINQLANEARDYIQRYDDYITKWLYSGPYKKAGIDGSAVFDTVFPPEQFDNITNISAESRDIWKPIPKSAITQMPIIDFIKYIPASDCCVYLKTSIISAQATKARLEVGSDDGIKVWLNGSVVHANNVMRGLTLGSDKFEVNLQAGKNLLIMKITQGNGDWRAACRIRSVDGLKLSGITIGEP